jgi:DNA repair exonuclease SbcCD ATPase subunit
MKRKLELALLLFLLLVYPVAADAQEASTAQQSVESLRSQLQDVEAKQSALEARLRQLDEEMRPENIERSLALTGSTRPEELRARRREQLEKERAGVQSQLDQLSTSHARLQAALSAAETAAYRQSAGVNTTETTAPQTGAEGTQAQPARSAQPTQPRTTRRRARRAKTRRRP